MTGEKCVVCGEARTASTHKAMQFAKLTTSYELLREVHS